MEVTHHEIRIERPVYTRLVTGEKTHWIFLKDTQVKYGDIVKFQVANSPDFITFKLGDVDHQESNFSVATLKPHSEKTFTRPFSLKGDGEKYKGAFFERRSG